MGSLGVCRHRVSMGWAVVGYGELARQRSDFGSCVVGAGVKDYEELDRTSGL